MPDPFPLRGKVGMGVEKPAKGAATPPDSCSKKTPFEGRPLPDPFPLRGKVGMGVESQQREPPLPRIPAFTAAMPFPS